MPHSKSLLQKMLSRIKLPMTRDQARSILEADFTKAEKQRYLQLSKKAQEGKLTERQAAELDEMLEVNSLFSVLRANAVQSLNVA